jgi:autotransporter-associated beta strand protein
MNPDHAKFLAVFEQTRRLFCVLAVVVLPLTVRAQVTVTESFTGTSASGWVFGGSSGSTSPYLTANTVDTPGDGWLRLTENTNNQSTYALFDSSIFSVNAQIQIEMEYAFWNGSGADGITFFLVDGNVDASTFQPGAYGGSLGYAQKDAGAAPPSGVAGMPGGYLGFGLDNFGNFSNPTEGRIGGPGSRPNAVAVRGPESSNYAYIGGATLNSYGQMDFPTSTTRPDQTGVDYRAFRITLDANNQLTVEMKFGASSSFVTAFTADLSAYDRPETFKIGFTGATGGSTEIHEVRNVAVTMTPWQPSAFEWDNGAGTTTWGNTPGGSNTNWYHTESGSNDRTPTVNADILFGNRPSSGPQSVALGSAVQLNSMTFDSSYNYSLSGSTITMGNTSTVGLPSINVNDYNGAQGQHHIGNALTLAEDLRINNYSFSTLCLNGIVTTDGNDITVNGNGAVNFNADIRGSGDLVKNGSGTTTINSNNSDGTTWTGDVIINQGMVVVTTNGALGTTGGTTTVNSGGVLAFRAASGNVNYSTAEAVTIRGDGVLRGGEGYTGAIYNDGGNNSFAGNITLAANSSIGSRDGVLTLSGQLSDGASTFNLTKRGEGVVELTNSGNNYNGATIINDGVLRISTSSNALAGGFSSDGYTGGNLQLGGGVLEINVNTTFNRRLGTGSDQVQWTGDGGFSAYGSNRTVSLTNSGGTANGTLTWNSGSFVQTGRALLLSSDYANRTVTLTNAINFNGGNREVRVANGSAAVDGILSGVLSNGGLIKTGDGTLSLSGANTYTGATEIRGGALRGTVSTAANLNLNGGVVEIANDFTWGLGTGAGQVRWTGDGGFSAHTNNRTVNLGGAAATLTWGSTANFVGANNKLILGSNSANRTVTLANGINLNGGNRTIRMQDGSATTDAVLSGVVSNGSLTVVGTGRLDATAANTLAGSVTVAGAELRLRGASGTMTAVTSLTVKEGGTFTMDNGSDNVTNRLNNAATISLNGGTLSLLGRTGNNNTTETVGAITLAGGASTINAQYGDSTGSAALTAASLARNAGATINFTNTGGTLGTTGDNPRIIFTAAPTLNDSVMGYATVNGTAFAGHGGNGVVAVASTNTAETAWTTSINAGNTADVTLTANRTVNSLNLGSGIDINLGGRTLTVDSGGILSTGATASIISNGTLRGGTALDELIAHVYGSGGLQISATITNNGDVIGLTKTGDGVLSLTGTTANSFTGTTYVNDGTLALGKSDNTTAIAGNIIVGDGRGTDILRLDADEQIANTSNLTLRGSEYGTGETILRFNGAGGAGVTESFGTLTIDGHAVIDFAGGNVCDANFLFLDDLVMATADSMLYIRNWVDFTDFLLVRNTANIAAVLDQIKFEGYEDMSYWQDYDANYSRITPVPEPATYGAILMGTALAGLGYRRWKTKRPAQAAV